MSYKQKARKNRLVPVHSLEDAPRMERFFIRREDDRRLNFTSRALGAALLGATVWLGYKTGEASLGGATTAETASWAGGMMINLAVGFPLAFIGRSYAKPSMAEQEMLDTEARLLRAEIARARTLTDNNVEIIEVPLRPDYGGQLEYGSIERELEQVRVGWGYDLYTPAELLDCS